MTYNSGQKPYRGVVYHSPSRVSSRVQTRTYPSPQIAPRRTIPPSGTSPLVDTQGSHNNHIHVNSDTSALSPTTRSSQVLPRSPPAQTVLFEASARALALEEEEELAQLSNLNLQQSKPATPSTHDADVCGDPEDGGTSKECPVCCEEKHTDLYPQTTATSDCRCLSDVCLVCIQQHIKSQTESKEWKEGSLTCPMCNRPLVTQEIEEYADGETLQSYLSHMIDQTIKEMPNFTRCPNPDCGSGQVHEGGDSHPFVTCAACNTQFCFRHGIPTHQQPPSEHETMSCDEYDRYLADPMRFRSEHQRQQERAEMERRELEAVARARARMDKILEQRHAAAATAAAAADDIRRRKEEEEAAREERERREREEREERARVEERRYEQERERVRAERRARAEEIMRREAEDKQSEWLIGVSTKGCPQCATRIEKNEGCMHMTCSCGYEFCWECTGPWVNNSCGNCFGGPVVQYE